MKHIILISIVIVIAACSKPQKTPYLTLKPDNHITGEAELYILQDDYQLFDKAIVDEESNHLLFIKDSVPDAIYELRINGQTVTTLLIKDTFPFSISGSFKTESNELTITGNEATKALWKCQSIAASLEDEIAQTTATIPDSIMADEYFRVRDSIYNRINHSIEKSAKDLKRSQKNHRNTLLPLLTAQLKAGNHYLLNRENEADYIYETSNQLSNLYPHYKPVRVFALQVDSIMSQNLFNSLTKEGRTLPSISITNAWGREFALDTLIDKPTLLVLWNSEELASRQVSKQLMRWSRSYRRQGLQICMISMDDNKDRWLAAIKEDRLALLHLSDLKGEDSPVMKEFGLTSLPSLLLLDDNRIIVKRARELEELRPAIQQIIKN
ncbi:redoxin domain-containing protein [Carboxylicivirga sp. A043]|uniref:TlpA family protein disulfide reductase n=1 Tax=Carboxylicivirga litoralis TaxID=2816963 RepID=UPI0021CB719E|nr:thioredoxin-like domain-containing protein [Carboxylicivirga sp. A043]MCU4156471.1 redoxin domain-containing protein [Carboxylicivirga sp. A043]